MKPIHSGNVVRLPLDQIDVGTRLRPVSEQGVEALILMAQDTGITSPIHVRKTRNGHVLIDGAHRIEAARRMELADIAALVWEGRADEAGAMEASNNLGGAAMSPLQTAVFVASWKRDYYEMHPDRKPGVFKGNRHTGKLVEDTMSLTRSIAQTFAITERQARRILFAGDALSQAEIDTLNTTGKPVTMSDLMALGKADPDARPGAVEAFTSGRVKRVSHALKPASKPASSPVEKGFKDLLEAWKRSPKVARRRFLETEGEAVAALLDELRPGPDAS